MSVTLFHIFKVKSAHSLSKYKIKVERSRYKGFFIKCKKYCMYNKSHTLYTEKDEKVYIKRNIKIRDSRRLKRQKIQIHTYKIFAEMENSNSISNEAYRHGKYNGITNNITAFQTDNG